MKDTYTHMDYRKARIIHLVNNEEERFIYQNKDISKEEAMEILLQLKKASRK